jgi:hypothetical protein
MYPGIIPFYLIFDEKGLYNLSACSAGCPSQGRFALQHAVGFPCTWRETVVQEEISIILSVTLFYPVKVNHPDFRKKFQSMPGTESEKFDKICL